MPGAAAASPTTAIAAATPNPQFGGGPVTAAVRAAPTATLAPQLVKTRWRKTPTTFGPLGRLVATFALVVPFVVLVVLGILTGGFTIGGALIWGFVLMPWGLRDTWRAGQLPAT